MNTSKRMREIIDSRGLTLYQLSLLSHVPYSTLKNCEARCGQLKVDTIERICWGLGITMADFFEDKWACYEHSNKIFS